MRFYRLLRTSSLWALVLSQAALLVSMAESRAAFIIASGQNNGDPTHATGNHYYSIDIHTGLATPISPQLSGSAPAGLASSGSQIVGFQGGQHGSIDPNTGVFTPSGSANGLTITGYDVLNGSGYGVPVSGSDRRLHQINLTTSVATPVGSGAPIADALDTFFGDAPGTNSPFVIGLGSVGNLLYGVHLGTNKNNLVEIDPSTGLANLLGVANAVGLSGNPGDGRFSGFAAMTGVDTNGNGVFDALYGAVNFYDPDAAGPLPSERLGGIARYDLSDGTWTMVGTNPGLIFFGFGSVAVPEPSAFSLLLLAGSVVVRRRRK